MESPTAPLEAVTAPTPVVLDTNVLLDLWVFVDPASEPLRQALARRQLRWLATPPMREEWQRVLDYPQIVRRLQSGQITREAMLARFDREAQGVAVPPKAPSTCKDADDQKFIDLAAAHQAVLLSKDQAVLCMARRLQGLGVRTLRVWPGHNG